MTNYRVPSVESLKQFNCEGSATMNENETNKLCELATLARESVVSIFPQHAKLGDNDLTYIKVCVPKEAIEGMTEEEASEFIVGQFPEHKWGNSSCWHESDGSFSVAMNEAEYQAGIDKRVNIDNLARQARESAVITVYGDIDVPDDDKQFVLMVKFDANTVLELMDENEFLELVVGQFPEYSWWDERSGYDTENGLIEVTLFSWGMMDKFYDDLIPQGMSTVKVSSMMAIHLDLVGYQRLAKVVKMNAFSPSKEKETFAMHNSTDLLKLFGEASPK